nr:MAG TPA: hypothetical protein [Caudoviricetes sp.]
MALTAKKVYAILKRQISDMEAKIKTPIIYRGTVATADLLPLNPDIGDMYNIESKSVYGEAGMNVAWNGVVWDTMGAPINMSLYIKSSELADWVKQQNKPTYTAEEVGALPADTKIPSKTSDLQNDSGFLTKIPDNYLSGTDKTLSVSGKAADAKATGDKIAELSADISKKLNKNQGSENSGKIAGINESGDIVPMFPVSVDYNEETNCLEFGSDQKMELNKGINLDSTLTKTGYAADAGAVGEITNSLKEDLQTSNKTVLGAINELNDIVGYDNAAAHNAIYRGKNLGTQFTAEMSANIKNGTFKDLYCGDYLVINGTTYRFMDLDYLYKTGDTSLEIHHILVVPDAPMYNHVMNDTDTTSGGYVGSKMYTSGLDQALVKVKADFGEAHIVTYRNLLVNVVSNSVPSNWAWYSRQIDLMNEEMVYGTRAWSQTTQNGYDTGSNKSQLAAFKHNHSLISSCRSWCWLRAVQSSANFCFVGGDGAASLNGASHTAGVRPWFLIS